MEGRHRHMRVLGLVAALLLLQLPPVSPRVAGQWWPTPIDFKAPEIDGVKCTAIWVILGPDSASNDLSKATPYGLNVTYILTPRQGGYKVTRPLALDAPGTTCIIGSSPAETMINSSQSNGFARVTHPAAKLAVQGVRLVGDMADQVSGIFANAGTLVMHSVVMEQYWAALWAEHPYAKSPYWYSLPTAPDTIKLSSVNFTHCGSGASLISVDQFKIYGIWFDPWVAPEYIWSDVHFVENVGSSSSLGGMYYAALNVAHSAKLTIYGSSFIGNTNPVWPGAVRVESGSILTLKGNTTFHGNKARYRGGAIYVDQSSLLVQGSLVMSNNAVEGDCGALLLTSNGDRPAGRLDRLDGDDSAEVFLGGDAVFTGNKATSGGAICVIGPTAKLTAQGPLLVANNMATGRTFDRKLQQGGGVMVSDGGIISFTGKPWEQFVSRNTPNDIQVLQQIYGSRPAPFFTCAIDQVHRGPGFYIVNGPVCACGDAGNATLRCPGCPNGGKLNPDGRGCQMFQGPRL